MTEVHQFDQYVVRVDGSGRITLCNHKFLRQYVPVQTQPPRHTIDDDLWHITKPLSKPNINYLTANTGLYARSSTIWSATCNLSIQTGTNGGGPDLTSPNTQL